MAKVWKDSNEVLKMIHDFEDRDLREIDREMTKKPNFDKQDKKKVRKNKVNNHH